METPSTSISPWRFARRPMIVRSKTDLPLPERDVVEHCALAEGDTQVLHADGGSFDECVHVAYIPIEAKKMANSPSSTMTRKMDLTTEAVVLSPRDSALPLTSRPSAHATMPIARAMNGALMRPTCKCVSEMA